MSGIHKAVLKQANVAVTAGDNERFLSFCTEDVVWNFVGDQILSGKQAVREYMASAYKEPPKFMVETYIEEGDYLTAVGDISMKDDDGKEVSYKYCDVWRFRDGKMAELKAFVVEA